MKIIFKYSLFFLLFPMLVQGQEIISGLTGNPVVEKHSKQQGSSVMYKSSFKQYSPLSLPFYDDFSTISIYPDTNLWLDNEAYINAEFAAYPVNYGVATMDVIDSRGRVYLEATPFTFVADHLTSLPIRLDSVYDPELGQMKELTPADSVYFSFYYQPQGRGDVPLEHDSLVLEFGRYSGDTIFSHFDSLLVFGYQYQEHMLQFGGEYLPPGFVIFGDESCDMIPYVIQDTFYFYDSLDIPCDSVFILDTQWASMWFAEGDTLDVFVEDNQKFFKEVIIPIEDTNWFNNDFQFRFLNYGSISNINSWQSNTDHWHIDVVRLDYGRSVADQYTRELSFVENPPSFIQDYSVMPFQHYAGDITRYKRLDFPVYLHNNDSVAHEVRYNYYVQNTNGDTLEPFLFDDIVGNLQARKDIDPFDYLPFVEPPIKYFFTSLSDDTADFRISHVAYDSQLPEVGDTVIYHQRFRNYFAYDDGSSEAGYGLSPAGAQLAVQFRSEVPDTLRGIQLYFNKTFNSNNNRLFHFGIWNDNNGQPGTLLHTEDNVRPEFPDGLNRFYTHIFDEYVKLGVQVFYVGWIQTTNHNLNIGYDRNVNSRERNFYNVTGEWAQSGYDGSIMIRPVVGKALKDEEPEYKSQSSELQVYPNPPGTYQEVTIQLPESEQDPSYRDYQVLRVYDIVGKVVYSGPYVEKLPVGSLKRGFYIIYLQNSATASKYTTKLLIAK